MTSRRPAPLWLPAAVIADMVREAWRTWPIETGGVLLGSARGAGAQVGRLVGPGPAARHERRSFTPDEDWQAAESRRHGRRTRRFATSATGIPTRVALRV